MIITSKLVVRILVVLMGLGIFVRGTWLMFFGKNLSNVDKVNVVLSFTVGIGAYVLFVAVFIFIVVDYIFPFIGNIWTGKKQLFKPFKINFKFKK